MPNPGFCMWCGARLRFDKHGAPVVEARVIRHPRSCVCSMCPPCAEHHREQCRVCRQECPDCQAAASDRDEWQAAMAAMVTASNPLERMAAYRSDLDAARTTLAEALVLLAKHRRSPDYRCVECGRPLGRCSATCRLAALLGGGAA